MSKVLNRLDNVTTAYTVRILNKILEKTASLRKTTVNHVFLVDCSGSMYYDLPKLNPVLKNRLPNLVKEGDSLSLGWFSGKGQYGFLQERVKFETPQDIQNIQNLIDRFLRPQCLTGFKESLQSVIDNYADQDISLYFLTDGHENAWPEHETLQVAKVLGSNKPGTPRLLAATVVGYGDYYNRRYLQSLAENLGGSFVVAEDFDKFEPTLEAQFQLHASKRAEYEVEGGYVYEVSDTGSVASYAIEEGKVSIPEDSAVYNAVLSTDDEAVVKVAHESQRAFLGLVQLLNNKGLSKEVKRLIVGSGDVDLYTRFSNVIGKQAVTRFSDYLAMLIKQGSMYVEGFSEELKEDPNAYCVLDLLSDLKTLDIKVKLNTPLFKYSKIGASSVPVVKMVLDNGRFLKEVEAYLKTKEGLTVTPELTEEMDLKIAELKTACVKEAAAPTFKYDYPAEGVSVSNLVYNLENPNISINVTLPITVSFPDDFKETLEQYGIPQEFPSKKIKSYAVINSGNVNTKNLIVNAEKVASEKELLWRKLKLIQQTIELDGFTFYVLDLGQLPITNLNRCRDISAADLANMELDKLFLSADQKVAKYFLDAVYSTKLKTASTFEQAYTAEGTEWLKEMGVTENGYNAPSKKVFSGDFYTAVQLDTKVAGISSLPAVKKDILDRVESGKKLNTIQTYMYEIYKQMRVELEGKEEILDRDQIVEMLKEQMLGQDKIIKDLNVKVAETKMSLMVSQAWFIDADGPDQTDWEIPRQLLGFDEPVKLKVSYISSEPVVKL